MPPAAAAVRPRARGMLCGDFDGRRSGAWWGKEREDEDSTGGEGLLSSLMLNVLTTIQFVYDILIRNMFSRSPHHIILSVFQQKFVKTITGD